MDENSTQTGLDVFRALKEAGEVEITPYAGGDPDSKPGFKPLPLNPGQRMQIAALSGQIPALMTAKAMSNAYILRFPEGVTGHLMRYKNGFNGSPIQNGSGRIVAHASFEQMSKQAVALSAFNVMALASGQYFLSEINSKLEKISLSIDKILEFLYGDKRAELLSEVSFTKYAYANYSSIMDSDVQRIATIAGLQSAKKVAIKDIEFYIADLDSVVNTKDISDMTTVVNKAFQIKDNLELAVQLCTMVAVLEMYYAQNYDPAYIDYVEQEMKGYISKFDNWILKDFGVLNGKIAIFKDKLLAKPVDKAALMGRITEQIELLTAGGESALHKSLHTALRAPGNELAYCVCSNGTIYLKAA